MKAVVLEISGNKAALLSDDGCVIKVKNENYEIGQEVLINMKKNISLKKKVAYMAASFAVVIGVGAATYYVPTTYVSMDVNPSIEYKVNMYKKVVSVKGVNEDGSQVIENISLTSLKNKSIDEAIRLTVNEVAQEGYLDSDKSGIVIATSSNDTEKATALAKSLEETANEACESNGLITTIVAEPVGKDRVQEAQELGVTPGKLNLVQKLIKSSEDPDSIDLKEWLNKPVKDIMAKTNENKEQNAEQEKNAGETTKNQEKNNNKESNGTTAVSNGNSAVTTQDKGTTKSNQGNTTKSTTSGKANSGSTTNKASNSDNTTNPSGTGNSSASAGTGATVKAGSINNFTSASGSGSASYNGKMGNN